MGVVKIAEVCGRANKRDIMDMGKLTFFHLFTG